MDYFEKNFKEDKLNSDQDLPEGFSWEEMKGGVMEKMEESKPAASNRWWLFGLLLLIGGCGGYLSFKHLSNDEIQSPIVKNTVQQLDEKTDLTTEHQQDSDLAQQQITDATSSDKIESTLYNSTINLSSIISTNTQKSTTSNTDKKPTNQLIESGLSKQVEIKIDSKKIDLIDQHQVKTKVVQPVAQFDGVSPLHNKMTELLTGIERKSFSFQPEFQKHSDFIQPKERSSFWTASLNAGIVNWKFNDQSDQNYAYVKGFPGYSINPSLTYHLNDRHGISLGYQYSFLQELFEYQGTYRGTKPVKDVLVSQLLSSITGSTISTTHKDTLLKYTQEQEVLN